VGSIGWGVRGGRLDDGLKLGQGRIPDVVEVRTEILNAGGVQTVDPASTALFLNDELSVLEDPEMLRDGGPANGEQSCDLINCGGAFGERLPNSQPSRISEGEQLIASVRHHLP
jgi:hypothetical protein